MTTPFGTGMSGGRSDLSRSPRPWIRNAVAGAVLFGLVLVFAAAALVVNGILQGTDESMHASSPEVMAIQVDSYRPVWWVDVDETRNSRHPNDVDLSVSVYTEDVNESDVADVYVYVQTGYMTWGSGTSHCYPGGKGDCVKRADDGTKWAEVDTSYAANGDEDAASMILKDVASSSQGAYPVTTGLEESIARFPWLEVRIPAQGVIVTPDTEADTVLYPDSAVPGSMEIHSQGIGSLDWVSPEVIPKAANEIELGTSSSLANEGASERGTSLQGRNLYNTATVFIGALFGVAGACAAGGITEFIHLQRHSTRLSTQAWPAPGVSRPPSTVTQSAPLVTGTAPAPAWYPDPYGVPNTVRYWDGSHWTNYTDPPSL